MPWASLLQYRLHNLEKPTHFSTSVRLAQIEQRSADIEGKCVAPDSPTSEAAAPAIDKFYTQSPCRYTLQGLFYLLVFVTFI